MDREPTSFATSLSGGVHHSPEADIESIRDLLRGYGVSRSILKELIQNAEDSGAKRMDIRLNWAASTKAQELSAVFDSFTQIAPLLAIFSRRIRTLIVKNGDDGVTITSKEEKLTESGRFTHIQVANKSYLCFRCQLRSDQRPASVLLPLDASGVSHLPENSPRLWITTPTTEHSDLRWAVNAPFKPDAGRQRLSSLRRSAACSAWAHANFSGNCIG